MIGDLGITGDTRASSSLTDYRSVMGVSCPISNLAVFCIQAILLNHVTGFNLNHLLTRKGREITEPAYTQEDYLSSEESKSIKTPFMQYYPIRYAGQCGDYFLVPPNSTFRMSVNFGVHHQDLGDLYCVLTFMADGGNGRKFCVNFTHINLREDSYIYIFEGENMEFPELYKHIIKRITKGEQPHIFCTNTNTLSIRTEYPILNGTQSPDVEFDVIPTDNVFLMKGNDCYKTFRFDGRNHFRVKTWPDESGHLASWSGCFLTFVHHRPGLMCVEFRDFYIGPNSSDVSLIFLLTEQVPIVTLTLNSSFPNATFCTRTEFLFVKLHQNVSFVHKERDYNFVFDVTAESSSDVCRYVQWKLLSVLTVFVLLVGHGCS